jgi:hypothetical protein
VERGRRGCQRAEEERRHQHRAGQLQHRAPGVHLFHPMVRVSRCWLTEPRFGGSRGRCSWLAHALELSAVAAVLRLGGAWWMVGTTVSCPGGDGQMLGAGVPLGAPWRPAWHLIDASMRMHFPAPRDVTLRSSVSSWPPSN